MPIDALLRKNQAEVTKRSLTPSVINFVDNAYKKSAASAVDVPVIHVSSVVSGAAVFYERVRYSLDYHEEHLLRRHALERILRRLFEDSHGVADSARSFLVELVQAKYLQNDIIPETTVSVVQVILDRYASALKNVVSLPKTEQKAAWSWLCGLSSAELDALLVPAPDEAALVNFMANFVQRDNPLEGWVLETEERRQQIYIACYRALFAFDPQTLHYLLLLRNLPDWTTTSADNVAEIWPRLQAARLSQEQALRHPAGDRLYRLSLKRRAVAFRVLRDIVVSHRGEAKELLQDEKRLQEEVMETCRRYYKMSRRRLYRSAIRSTIYILLTKVILAVAVEAPVEQYLYGAIASMPLVVNLLFPPSLMVLLTITTRFPGNYNSEQMSLLVTTLVYGSERAIFPKVKPIKSGAHVSRGAFTLFYIIVFILTFGGIIWFLGRIGFTSIGMAFALFFLCVVSFFALRIRQQVRDLFVTKHRENPIVSLIDFFSLPILKLGQLISLTSAKFNVFLYLFDYFLEAPLKTFLLVFEDVLGSFKEKREELF